MVKNKQGSRPIRFGDTAVRFDTWQRCTVVVIQMTGKVLNNDGEGNLVIDNGLKLGVPFWEEEGYEQ